MKKIILGLLVASSFINAGKIFLEYTFDMSRSEINKINQLTEIVDDRLAPKPLKLYKDEYNQNFIFLKDKLKIVHINIEKIDFKKSIEDTLKSGFRLKKILAKTKYGEANVKNVGELLKLVDKITIESIVFDSFINTELQFENGEGQAIIMTYKKYVKRENSDCIKCDEINGKISKEYETLEYYFTEKPKS